MKAHDNVREVEYGEFASYVAELRAKGPFAGYTSTGIQARIWRALVETLLGIEEASSKAIQTTPIPLAQLREGLASGCDNFRNMSDTSWQIFTGFMETIS